MLFIPKSGLPPTRSKTGIARGSSSGGNWLRARAAVVNTNSTGQSRWRHIFQTNKRNWLALGPGGGGDIPVDGIQPQAAWSYQAGSYQGIPIATPPIDNVFGMNLFIGCATEEAYNIMCQNMRAQLGLTPLPSPTITGWNLDPAGVSNTVTNDGIEVNVGVGHTEAPGYSTAPVIVSISGTNPPIPAPPAPTTNTSWSITGGENVFAATPGTVIGFDLVTSPIPATLTQLTWTASGLPSGVTIQTPVSYIGYGASMVMSISSQAVVGTSTITLTAQAGTGVATWAVTLLIATTTNFPVTLALPDFPSQLTAVFLPAGATDPQTLGSQTMIMRGSTDSSTWICPAQMLIWGNLSATPGTYTVSVEATVGSASCTCPITTTWAAGNNVPAMPAPLFTMPNYSASGSGSLAGAGSAETLYDGDYNVTGLKLSYELVANSTQCMSRFGTGVTPTWSVTASPSYTSGYTKPPGSSYLVISNNAQVWPSAYGAEGPFAPDAEDILDAWQGTFGALPTTGNIAFTVTPVDPVTGSTGPTVSFTANWSQGTLKGGSFSNWLNNYGGEPPDPPRPAFGYSFYGPAGQPASVSGSGPYVIPWDTEGFQEGSPGPFIYYAGSNAPPFIGPCASVVTGTPNYIAVTVPSGAPAITTSSYLFTALSQVSTDYGSVYDEFNLNAGQSATIFASVSAALYSDNPTPVYRPYSGTISAELKAGGWPNTGVPSTYKSVPAGLSLTATPGTVEIDSGDTTQHWITLVLAADDTCNYYTGLIGIEITDSVQTVSAKCLLVLTNLAAQPLPQNYLNVLPGNVGWASTTPGVSLYTFTAQNSGPGQQDIVLAASSQDPDISVEFGQFAQCGATATATSITFALATGATENSLIGWEVSSVGYSPAGYNVTDAPIIANDATTVTVLCNNNPGTMTVAGSAGVIGTQVTVAPQTLLGPYAAPATINETTITFPNVFGAAPGALAGQVLTMTGYGTGIYPYLNEFITTNDADTITLPASSIPLTTPSAGNISIYMPGSTTFGVLVTIANPQTEPVSPIWVTLGAGSYTCYAYIGYS